MRLTVQYMPLHISFHILIYFLLFLLLFGLIDSSLFHIARPFFFVVAYSESDEDFMEMQPRPTLH